MTQSNLTRRQWLARCATWAAGTLASRSIWAADANTWILGCPDPRFISYWQQYRQSRQIEDAQVIELSGASLGAVQQHLPFCDPSRFWRQMARADSARPGRILILDHQDCMAYRMVFGQQLTQDVSRLRQRQFEQHQALSRQLRERYPLLEIESLWMSSSGVVSRLAG